MLLPEVDAKTKALELRIATLEKALSSTGKSLVLQVGNSKIEITAAGITLNTPGDIQVRTFTNFNLMAGANVSVKAGANMNLEASGTAVLKAGATLSLKGAVINQN
jgi:uncharacterized protein (DUF2345 family)